MARRRTTSDAEAEDCVSEAIVRCVEFEGLDEARVAAFLTTVTLRLCADQHRSRARLMRAGGHLVGGMDEPSPEEAVCDRAEAAWLAETLDISPHQRRVVEARAEGLSCEEVARRFGLSVDAVKSAAARVRVLARTTVARTLGTLPPVYGRRTGLLAGGAVAGAVATVTVGGLLLGGPVEPARPHPWSAPVVELERRVPRVPATLLASRPETPRVEVPGVRRLLPVTTVPDAPVTVPDAPKAVTVLKDPTGGEVTSEPTGYSTPERLMHCITEGISIYPETRCNLPEEDR
jgi:RNA polymerase sigma factor (sigma-70 family)